MLEHAKPWVFNPIKCNFTGIVGRTNQDVLTIPFFVKNMIHPVILLAVFVVCTIAGYLIIKNVPSLLHTPLMSGMNALSGVTVVGAISATGFALLADLGCVAQIIGCLAIILATVNVFGGFGVTHRMLQMFNKKKAK